MASNPGPPVAAMEYNAGRTLSLAVDPAFGLFKPGEPVSHLALRVLLVLVGLWLDLDAACDVLRGRHAPACGHASNELPYSLSGLAAVVYGPRSRGGRQIAKLQGALRELAAQTTVILWHGKRGFRFEQVSHVLSYGQNTTPSYARGVVSWDPFLHRSLMAGHFQLMPIELARLNGNAIRLWVGVLSQIQVARIGRRGRDRRAEISLSGLYPETLPLRRIGLSGRTDKVRMQLERYAALGNSLQADWRLSIQPRNFRGLKVVVERIDRSQPQDDEW